MSAQDSEARSQKPEAGFTLVELLVVITIIAILSIIGLAVYSVVLKNGRDAKRQTDLRSVQSALEQHYSDFLYYPSAVTFNGSTALSNGSKTYLNAVPADPTNSNDYIYCYKGLKSASSCDSVDSMDCDNATSDKCVKYCMYAKLENPPAGAVAYKCATATPRFTLKVSPP